MRRKDMFDYAMATDDFNQLNLRLRQLYDIIESSYDGLYITDGHANTIMVNRAYEKITGLKREQMLGKNMAQIEGNGIISKSGTLLVLKNKKTVTIEQQFKNGKNVLISSTPIFDTDGKITMVVTNVRDVTELYELKEQLEKNLEITQKYYSELEMMRKQILEESDIIASDDKMLGVLEVAKKVAKVDTTVLVMGETGVGKEVVAKFVHKHSSRVNNAFVKINCGAIPDNLIESELFGYEKGAFTGASKDGKIGMFELADNGTLFLDEIGELPLDMQVKLLRVLQENEFKRVGGTASIKVNVRVVAATNRNLKEMVEKKLFREDLYYRLHVIPINIPPLRERKADIEPLVTYFLNTFNKSYDLHKTLAQSAMNCLKVYEWPGNVRELRNIIERVAIMSSDDKITMSDLPISRGQCDEEKFVIENKFVTLKEAVEKLEASMIESSFEKHGNVRSAARELGIDASTFVRKRKRYESENLL